MERADVLAFLKKKYPNMNVCDSEVLLRESLGCRLDKRMSIES